MARVGAVNAVPGAWGDTSRLTRQWTAVNVVSAADMLPRDQATLRKGCPVAAKCRKCNKEVKDCSICRGGGTVSTFGSRTKCTRCDGTGKQCNEHGKHWK